MFVPFARLLRMWDERPEDFDEYEIHSLHWVFKWMSAGMLDQPHVPLASIEKWLGEMEHRYRLAGHSERAVRSAEFSVAAHLGRPGARRAGVRRLAGRRPGRAWPTATRASCTARAGGRRSGAADAEALELWRAGPGGRVHLRPRAAHGPRVLPAAAAAAGPRRRGPRPPSARLPAGAPHGEHARRVRGPRGVLRADRQRGARPGAARGAPGVLHGLRAPAQQAGLPGRGGAAHGPADRAGSRRAARCPGRPAGRGPRAELAAHARGEALELAARFDARNGTSLRQ